MLLHSPPGIVILSCSCRLDIEVYNSSLILILSDSAYNNLTIATVKLTIIAIALYMCSTVSVYVIAKYYIQVTYYYSLIM